MQVLKQPKCGPTWSGLEEQGDQVGSPDRAQSSSTPTVSSHQHKALGSPCYSHLRRQRASTVYHGILVSVCLCLQMPILTAEALQAQGPCRPVMDILDGNANLSCKLENPQNVENIQNKCTKFPDSPVVYLCKDWGDKIEENMTEYAGWPIIMAGSEMCNGTMILTFLNDSWHSNCMFKNGRKVKDAESTNMPVLKVVLPVTIVPILLSFIVLYINKNKLKNYWKNRSNTSQPSPSQAIQTPYVPAPNTDPEDDDLHSVATDGNADTAATTVDTHDAVPGETSASSTEDPYPSGTATVDAFLTADSESANAYDSKAHDSTYCDSYDTVSLGSEACGPAVAALLAAKVKNELLSKRDSQKQLEMQVFSMNRQV